LRTLITLLMLILVIPVFGQWGRDGMGSNDLPLSGSRSMSGPLRVVEDGDSVWVDMGTALKPFVVAINGTHFFSVDSTGPVYIYGKSGAEGLRLYNGHFYLGSSASQIRFGSSMVWMDGTGFYHTNYYCFKPHANKAFEVAGVSYVSGVSSVASATPITLGYFNNFTITGTADIDSFDTASNLPDYSVIYLVFSGTAGSTGLTDGKNLNLAGNFGYTPDDVMVLQKRGDYLFELSRSVN